MPLQAKIRYPRVDKAKSTAKLDKAMSEQTVEALRTWVLSTTAHVPVLTGASKASFIKLAREAQVTLTIVPKTISRIEFGIENSVGEILREKGVKYGWIWRSDLVYIHIVDANNSFLAAGEAALKAIRLKNLPQPVFRTQIS